MEYTFDTKPSCKADEYLRKLKKEANKGKRTKLKKLIEKRGKQLDQLAQKKCN